MDCCIMIEYLLKIILKKKQSGNSIFKNVIVASMLNL